MKPSYRKSWAGNLLLLSDMTLGSSLKVLITRSLLVLEVCNVSGNSRRGVRLGALGFWFVWSAISICGCVVKFQC